MNTTTAIVERQISEHIHEALKLSGATTREQEMRSSGAFLDLSRRELREYSLLRAIDNKLKSIMNVAGGFGPGTFAGVEGEADRELQKRFGASTHPGRLLVPADYLYRDATVASQSGGGYLVGTKNVSFIDMLRNFSAAFRLGVQRLSGQRENISLPRQTNTSTIVWLSNEGSTATESSATFDQVTGAPNTASAYQEISRQLLKQSNPDAELVVMRGLAADVATAADGAVFAGTGTEQPQGIIGTSGVGTSISGATMNYSGLVQAQKDIADGNAVVDPTALGYVTTPTVAALLKGRQRFTGTDSPLWSGAIHEGEIEGVRALSTKQIPTGKMIFGDFSQCAVAEWGVLAVEVNPFADFKSGIVGVRCLYSMDVLVLHPESFTVISSIT